MMQRDVGGQDIWCAREILCGDSDPRLRLTNLTDETLRVLRPIDCPEFPHTNMRKAEPLGDVKAMKKNSEKVILKKFGVKELFSATRCALRGHKCIIYIQIYILIHGGLEGGKENKVDISV